MPRKRDRLEIIYSILSIIQNSNNSIKRTPLLRYTNISSQSFNDYYKELIDKEFMSEETDRKGKMFIALTDKGFAFLEKYKYILGFIEEFDL